MLVLCYPKCTTCKKAIKYLDEHNIKYDLRDIKQNNPSYDEIKSWHELSKLDIKKFFNTSGNLYKELNLKDKLPTMTIDEKYQLLASDGMLVKRPLVIKDDLVLVGFKQDEWDVL